MKLKREDLLLYAITDRSWLREGESLASVTEEILKGGATCLQLREKAAGQEEMVRLARELLPLCRAYGVPLIINDNVEVCRLVDADGVHVGSGDMPVEDVRRLAGRDFIIGATAKTAEQAAAAEKAGADYIGIGAVFPSPTKSSAVRITTRQLKEICSFVSIPAVAIGGINENNIEALKGCGAAGVAVISAIFGAPDIAAAAAALKEKAKEVLFL